MGNDPTPNPNLFPFGVSAGCAFVVAADAGRALGLDLELGILLGALLKKLATDPLSGLAT